MADLLSSIRQFEGFTPRASWDYRQHSNGYGTRARSPGEVIDRDEAERRLQSEVANARAIVEQHAPNADPGTKDALTSLTYNAGDAWTRSGLGQAIQAGDTARSRDLFLQYDKAGGEVNPGLVARRQQEAAWMGAGAPAAPQTALGSPAPANVPQPQPTIDLPPAASPGGSVTPPNAFGSLASAFAPAQSAEPSMDDRIAQMMEDQKDEAAATPKGAAARRPATFGSLAAAPAGLGSTAQAMPQIDMARLRGALQKLGVA